MNYRKIFILVAVFFVQSIGFGNAQEGLAGDSHIMTTSESNILIALNSKIDSVCSKTFKELERYDGRFLIKVGSIYMDTDPTLAKNLLALKNAIHISNPDQTVDVYEDASYTRESEAEKSLKKYWEEGFFEAIPGRLKLSDSDTSFVLSNKYNESFALALGVYDKEVPTDQQMMILSVKNIKTVYEQPSKKYIYFYGVFYEKKAIEKAAIEARKKGFKADVLRYGKGLLFNKQPSDFYDTQQRNDFVNKRSSPDELNISDVTFRVQIGLFKASSINEVFTSMPVVIVPHEKQLSKVYSGSFENYKEAYRHKLLLKDLGFKGVFNVAYKGGNSLVIKDLVTPEEFSAIQAEIGR